MGKSGLVIKVKIKTANGMCLCRTFESEKNWRLWGHVKHDKLVMRLFKSCGKTLNVFKNVLNDDTNIHIGSNWAVR